MMLFWSESDQTSSSKEGRSMMIPDERTRAKKLVDAKIGFTIHLVVYLVVNAVLVVVNLLTSTSYLWFIWPLLGWGLGLLMHATLIVFLFKGSAFRQRMIEREMERRVPPQ